MMITMHMLRFKVEEKGNNMKMGSETPVKNRTLSTKKVETSLLPKSPGPQGLDIPSRRSSSISSVESFSSEEDDIDERRPSASSHTTSSHERRKETLRSIFRRKGKSSRSNHHGRYEEEGGIGRSSKSSPMSRSGAVQMREDHHQRSDRNFTTEHEEDDDAAIKAAELGRKKRSTLRGRIMRRLPSPSAVFRRRSASLSLSRGSQLPFSTNNIGRHRSYTQGMEEDDERVQKHSASSPYDGQLLKEKISLQSTSSVPPAVDISPPRRGGLRQRLASRVRKGLSFSLSPRRRTM